MDSSAHDRSAAADRRLATVGRLAGAIAHDFNNQLTAILGYAGLLLEEFPEGDARRADLLEVQRSGERAATLTRLLLGFRRNADAPPQAMSWAALLEELRPLLASAAGERVSWDLSATDRGEVELQKADASHVAFALALLAGDVLPEKGRCRVEVSRADAIVVLAISLEADGGTLRDVPEATLADLARLAEESGGRLEVETGSAPGVRLTIRYGTAAARAEAPVASSTRAPGRVAVLLAEDERPLRQIIRRMLEHHDFTVVDAADGAAALELSRAQPAGFDVLLTDVVMPGSSGVDLARAVLEAHPQTVVLFMSGYVDGGTLDLATIEAPCGFLAKPFTREQLVGAIRGLVARRREE